MKTANSTKRLRELCFESRARAGLLLLLLLLSACGRADVVLVTDKPLASGTVFQDERLLQSGDGVASTKYLVRAEVRPDGTVGLVYHRDPNGASDGPLSLDGIPIVWRGTPEGWIATLEHGSPVGAQASDLKTIAPPFLTNSIYPARPVHVGERWALDAGEIRALITQVSGSALWSKALNDDGALSGWMELASLADRDGQQCALLHFEVTIRLKWIDTIRTLQVRGDAVRSLLSFQDLSMKAKAEWTDPVTTFGSASFNRSVTPPAQQSAPALAAQQHISSDRQGAADWANRYRNAPSITEAEFLQQVSEVKLEMETSGGPFEQEELEAGLQRALQAEGLRINPQAPVTLHVAVRFRKDDITDHVYGTDVIEETFHDPVLLEFISMRFLVSTQVYRDGTFQQLVVAPATCIQTNGFTGSGSVGKQNVMENLPDSIHTMLSTIRESNNRPTPEEDTSWRESLWNEQENERMYQQYVACQVAHGIDLERVFRGVNRLKLHIELENDASRCINRSWIENEWGSALKGAGLPLDPGSPFQIYYQILTVRTAHTIFGIEGAVCYTNADVIEVRQDDVVFPLPGQKEVKLVRKTVQIDEHDNLGTYLPKDKTNGLAGQIDRSIEEASERLRFRR
jgi:hypothetical protein